MLKLAGRDKMESTTDPIRVARIDQSQEANSSYNVPSAGNSPLQQVVQESLTPPESLPCSLSTVVGSDLTGVLHPASTVVVGALLSDGLELVGVKRHQLSQIMRQISDAPLELDVKRSMLEILLGQIPELVDELGADWLVRILEKVLESGMPSQTIKQVASAIVARIPAVIDEMTMEQVFLALKAIRLNDIGVELLIPARAVLIARIPRLVSEMNLEEVGQTLDLLSRSDRDLGIRVLTVNFLAGRTTQLGGQMNLEDVTNLSERFATVGVSSQRVEEVICALTVRRALLVSLHSPSAA